MVEKLEHPATDFRADFAKTEKISLTMKRVEITREKKVIPPLIPPLILQVIPLLIPILIPHPRGGLMML